MSLNQEKDLKYYLELREKMKQKRPEFLRHEMVGRKQNSKMIQNGENQKE